MCDELEHMEYQRKIRDLEGKVKSLQIELAATKAREKALLGSHQVNMDAMLEGTDGLWFVMGEE